MKIISRWFKIASFLALTLSPLVAQAEKTIGDHRFGLGAGLIYVNKQTTFAVSGEYEYRMDPLYGLGAQFNYVFSSQATTLLSVPVFYFHPLSGDWYISAGPVFQFNVNSTKVGARFTTRMPLDMDILMLTPTFGVDIIQGGPNYIFGLSLSI